MTQMEGLRRICDAFLDKPETMLQEIVNSAIDLCGADSAGISLEQDKAADDQFFLWVATAGEFAVFKNSTMPRYPSACGVCLDRGRPQLFRLNQTFYRLMGVEAPDITDGILLPWQIDGMRGTIWMMAHGRMEAFDQEDFRTIQNLADFAAMAYRRLQKQGA